MKTIIENMYEAFTKGNRPAVIATMDDNIVLNGAEGNSHADGNPYERPDAVLNGVFASLGNEW